MKFKTPTHEGIFLKRYKRFFADVRLGKDIVVAHVANTGSLKTATEIEAACLLTEADNPERKLRYTLEAVKVAGSWVGVNTSWPNHLAKETFEAQVFPHWKKFDELKSEVKLSAETRIDLVLRDSKKDKKHFVEIKNVSMGNDGCAQFPDAVTERGQKHLRELIKLVKEGHTAEILFAIQRSDCKTFSPADDIDPEYGRLLREADKVGVKITAALIDISPKDIRMTGETVKVKL